MCLQFLMAALIIFQNTFLYSMDEYEERPPMMIAVRVVKQIIDLAFAGVFIYNMVFFIQVKRHKLAL